MTLPKFWLIELKKVFSRSFSLISDGLFGFSLSLTPKFPLIMLFAATFSSSSMVLSFLMPAMTLSIFLFISSLITPNSSVVWMSSLLGAVLLS